MQCFSLTTKQLEIPQLKASVPKLIRRCGRASRISTWINSSRLRDWRDNYASLTIQTTPELAQQVIDYIRANPDPSLWTAAGPNCSSEVAKILSQFKLDNQSKWDVRQGMTPKILWHSLMSRYNPSQNRWGATPNRGRDYGNSRYDMFNLLWLSLPQSQPKATVTVTVTNCVTDSNGKKTCDTQ
jgi:hypothetical protein